MEHCSLCVYYTALFHLSIHEAAMRLIQPRELYGPPERQKELEECWAMNDLLHLNTIALDGQPTFTALLALCGEGVNIICNSDIQVSPEMVDALSGYIFRPKECFALSRWEDGALYNQWDSQDCWVFLGCPPAINGDFRMGTAGCDNRLVWELRNAGMVVRNPSKTLKVIHHHRSGFRSYLQDPQGVARRGDKIERVPGPYSFAKPEEL
jgi:hypothetical protein